MALAVQCNFVSPGDPPACVVGVPYSHFFTQTGGAGLFYIFPGILPSGLTLNGATGEISGTPDGADFAPGAVSKVSGLTVSVFDSGTLEQASILCGMTAYLNCILLTPSCNNPPGGAVGVPYTHNFSALFGIAPYTYSITGGALPDGLAMGGDGVVTGTPGTNGAFGFFLTVTGSGDPTNNQTTIFCSIIIGGVGPNKSPQMYFYGFGFLAPLTISCNNPPDGVVGSPYAHSLTFVPSGVPPYVFSIHAGALPPGLALNPGTGEITGTPTLAGLYAFTARVTDNVGSFADVDCTILITAAVVPSPRPYWNPGASQSLLCEKDYPWVIPPAAARPVFLDKTIPAPAAAAGVTLLLEYEVPDGYYLIVHAAMFNARVSGFIDGAGSILWTVDTNAPINGALLNARPVGQFTASLGDLAEPQSIGPIMFNAGDTVRAKVLITDNTLGVGLPNTITASLVGWIFPLSRNS
jgi:Putative Ig domain